MGTLRRAAVRALGAGALAAALACALLAGVATPRLCAQPVDIGSALRDLVEDGNGAESAPARTSADGVAAPAVALMAVGDTAGVAERLRQVRRLSRSHAVRYPAHVALGRYLETLGCSPVAVAVQWIKASFHARTVTEAVEAGDGIARAAARDPAGVVGAACAHDPAEQRPLVRHAVSRAGIACPPGA